MRFRAHIINVKSMQLLSNVIATISKTVQSCVIHFTTEKIYFFMSEGSLSDQNLYCVVNQARFFHEYRCEETDGSPSELYIRLHIALLSEAFKTGQNAMEIKMKLQTKSFGDDGIDSPCLRIIVTLPAISKTHTVLHDVKVELIPESERHLFQEPGMPELDASVVIPDIKLIKTQVEHLKKLSPNLKIAANKSGNLFLKVESDEASVKISFKDLEAINCDDVITDGSDSLDDMKEVTVDIKKFLQILHANFDPTRVICNIVCDCALQVFLCIEDQVVFQYLLPAIILY